MIIDICLDIIRIIGTAMIATFLTMMTLGFVSVTIAITNTLKILMKGERSNDTF